MTSNNEKRYSIEEDLYFFKDLKKEVDGFVGKLVDKYLDPEKADWTEHTVLKLLGGLKGNALKDISWQISNLKEVREPEEQEKSINNAELSHA